MYKDKNYPFTVGVPDCFRASFVSVNIISVACCAWAEQRCWPGPAPYSRNKSQTFSARFLCLFICLLTAWTHCLSEKAGKTWLQSILIGDVVRLFIRITGKVWGLGVREFTLNGTSAFHLRWTYIVLVKMLCRNSLGIYLMLIYCMKVLGLEGIN